MSAREISLKKQNWVVRSKPPKPGPSKQTGTDKSPSPHRQQPVQQGPNPDRRTQTPKAEQTRRPEKVKGAYMQTGPLVPRGPLRAAGLRAISQGQRPRRWRPRPAMPDREAHAALSNSPCPTCAVGSRAVACCNGAKGPPGLSNSPGRSCADRPRPATPRGGAGRLLALPHPPEPTSAVGVRPALPLPPRARDPEGGAGLLRQLAGRESPDWCAAVGHRAQFAGRVCAAQTPGAGFRTRPASWGRGVVCQCPAPRDPFCPGLRWRPAVRRSPAGGQGRSPGASGRCAPPRNRDSVTPPGHGPGGRIAAAVSAGRSAGLRGCDPASGPDGRALRCGFETDLSKARTARTRAGRMRVPVMAMTGPKIPLRSTGAPAFVAGQKPGGTAVPCAVPEWRFTFAETG